jgi:hypothetical protein
MKSFTLAIMAAILFILVCGVTTPRAQDAFANGYTYTHVSTATSTQVASISQLLHTVVVNGGTTGAVTLYDNASACSGTVIGTIQAATAPVTLDYDIQLKNGLCVVTAAATDITVSTR